MSGSLTVRPARSGDGPGIAVAWVDCGRYYSNLDWQLFQVPDAEGLSADFEADLAAGSSATECRLVADVSDDAVGYLAASLHPSSDHPGREFNLDRTRPSVWVDLLIVQAQWRRVGAGDALIRAAEAWATERNATTIELDTFERSPLSVPFYEHRGYQRRAVRLQKRLL